MIRAARFTLALLISLGLGTLSAIAADDDSTDSSSAVSATAETAVSAAPDSADTAQAPADNAPMPMPAPTDGGDNTPDVPIPALKPIVITFSGELSSVDTSASPAAMTVQDRYGVRKEIAIPAEAKVSQGADTKAVADLKVGDKLTVEYTYDVATGKRTAQAISIGEAAVSKPVTTQ